MTDPLDISEWIERVNDEGVNLTAWELGFMESITEQFERQHWLSDQQVTHLEQIYSERTP